MHSRLKSIFFILIVVSIPIITPLITTPMPSMMVSGIEPSIQQQQNYLDYSGIQQAQVQLTPGAERLTLAGPGSNTVTSPGSPQSAPPINLANSGTAGSTTSNSPPASPSSTTATNNTFNLTIGSQVFPISYTIEGGHLRNLTVLPSNSTLLVDLATTETSFGGKLTINLPRSVIDAIDPTNNGDRPFLVFDDGNPITQSVLEQGQNQQTRPLDSYV